MNLIEVREKINEVLAEKRAADIRLAAEKVAFSDSTVNLTDAEDAQELLQHSAALIQQLAHQKIASIVSRCLSVIFDEPYEFKIDFERKRGRTEASLRFVRDGIAIDPVSACGGGVVDVAAFALRLASLLLTRPAKRRVLVMDEPFRFLSQEYRGRMRGLLESLADEMNVQFIMVTHIDELRCGKVIEMS